MYHSVKSVKKRRKRRALLLTQTILALLLAVLAAFVLEEAEQESPAGTVTVAFRGRLYRASSGQTVRQTLKGLGLSWDEADVLSAAEDTVLERGMVLTVDRVEQRQEVYTQVLPAGTVYCRDLSLPEGTQALLEAGQDGELRCTAAVEYVNGLERSRTVTERELLREPVSRVVAVGTREEETAMIQNGRISLRDGSLLTYTKAVTLRASAFPGGEESHMTLDNGTRLRIGTVAVDTGLIPEGTRLFIQSADGTFLYGIAVAVPGMSGDRAELYFPTAAECMAFGEQTCIACFLG